MSPYEAAEKDNYNSLDPWDEPAWRAERVREKAEQGKTMNTPPYTVEQTSTGWELKGPSASFTYTYRADATAQADHLNTAWLLGFLAGQRTQALGDITKEFRPIRIP